MPVTYMKRTTLIKWDVVLRLAGGKWLNKLEPWWSKLWGLILFLMFGYWCISCMKIRVQTLVTFYYFQYVVTPFGLFSCTTWSNFMAFFWYFPSLFESCYSHVQVEIGIKMCWWCHVKRWPSSSKLLELVDAWLSLDIDIVNPNLLPNIW